MTNLTYEDESLYPLQSSHILPSKSREFCEVDRSSVHVNNDSHRQSWLSVLNDKKKQIWRKSVIEREFSMNSTAGIMQRDACGQTCSDWSSGDQQKKGTCGPLSWSILPVVLSITSVAGFMTTYLFAKSNCHIEKWILPYLSYTGTEYPESMVFGMILNTEGFLGLTVVFLAWRYYQHMGQRGCLNHFTLLLGALSCFGVIMVGNFQVTKAKVPHYIGAGLAFIIGTSYSICTCCLSKRAFKVANPPLRFGTCMSVTRTVIALTMAISLTCLSGVGVYKKNSGRNKSQEIMPNAMLMYPNGSCPDMLSKVPPYVRYVDLLGSVTEWVLTACLLVCLSLFAYEFKTFQKVKVVLLRHDGPLNCNNNCNYRPSRPNYNNYYAATLTTENEAPSAEKFIYARSGQELTEKYQVLDSRCDAGQLQVKMHISSFSSLSPRVSRSNVPADSGIEDDGPNSDESTSSSSNSVVERNSFTFFPITKRSHSRSLPNIAAIEAV